MHRHLMVACAAAAFVMSGAAQAQSAMSQGAMSQSAMSKVSRMETVLCPTNVKVMITPSPAAAGWSYSNATAPMHLDPANPPHVDPTILVCYYVFVTGNNAFDYSQPLNGRTCTVNAAKTGFQCHH